MDFSKLSDAELERIAGSAPAASSYSSMSDEELEKIASGVSAPGKKAEKAPRVLNEMHPEITAADRFVVKNFSKDNEVAANHLRKRHPNLEIVVDKGSDQILVRKKPGPWKQQTSPTGEEEWRVLDPDSTLEESLNPLNIGETAQDISDASYAILSDVGTSAATALGGLAGGMATGGLGALPTAALAGGGASVGLEGLRQGIGSALGLEDNFSGLNLGLAGTTGVVSPFFFGTGATARQAVKKGVDLATQRGGIGRGWDYAKGTILPKLGSLASGVDTQRIATLGKEFPLLQRLEADPMGATKFTKKMGSRAGEAIRTERKELWKKVKEGVKRAVDVGDKADLEPVKAQFKAAIGEAESLAKRGKSEAFQETVASLKSKFDELFTYPVEVPTGAVDELGNPIMETIRQEITDLDADAAMILRTKLSEMAKMQASPKSQMGIGNRMAPSADKASKEFMELSRKLKDTLDSSLDQAIGDEATQARKLYGAAKQDEDAVKEMFENPKIAAKTMRNLDKMPNRTDLELINRLDEQYGTGLADDVKKFQMYSTFSNPSHLPLATKGASSYTRAIPAAALGGAAGWALGREAGADGYGAPMSGFLGAGAGAFLGGPAALRKYVQIGLLGNRAGEAVREAGRIFDPRQAAATMLIGRPVVENTWNLLGGQQP